MKTIVKSFCTLIVSVIFIACSGINKSSESSDPSTSAISEKTLSALRESVAESNDVVILDEGDKYQPVSLGKEMVLAAHIEQIARPEIDWHQAYAEYNMGRNILKNMADVDKKESHLLASQMLKKLIRNPYETDAVWTKAVSNVVNVMIEQKTIEPKLTLIGLTYLKKVWETKKLQQSAQVMIPVLEKLISKKEKTQNFILAIQNGQLHETENSRLVFENDEVKKKYHEIRIQTMTRVVEQVLTKIEEAESTIAQYRALAE